MNERKRVNMMLPVKMVYEIDKLGMSLGLNRTSTFIIIIKQYLDNQTLINMKKELGVSESVQDAEDQLLELARIINESVKR